MPAPPTFSRDWLAAGARWLAERGVFIGTSSWKYEGWLGQIYSPERYMTRGRLSQGKFERDCLAEYAQVFHTVCVDAGYYRFPTSAWLQQLMDATPEHFRFSFKVTDEITARTFPNLPRHGPRAGQRNEHFLSADLFNQAFLTPLEPWRARTGVLIFEFSHFHARDFERGRDFVEALAAFLGALPSGWSYAVEVRNQNLLQPDYFSVLRQHGVAHVFNQWTRMPDAAEQMQLPGSTDCAGFTCARLLLKRDRGYEEAVAKFSPYSSIKETHESARTAAVTLIQQSLTMKEDPQRKKAFIYVNNRLEGNALETIAAVFARLDIPAPPRDVPRPSSEEPFNLQ